MGVSTATAALIEGQWQEILGGIAAGDLVRDVLKRAGVTHGQIRHYLDGRPRALQEWKLAQEESAGAYMDEALEVARSEIKDSNCASHARTRIDTLKWASRIRDPRRYSDKSQLDVNVKTLDLTSIITAAQARLEAARPARVIDVRPLEDAARDLLEG